MARRAVGARSRGWLIFSLFVFMLMAIPKTNIQLGPIPLYLIDLVIIACLFVAAKQPRQAHAPIPFRGLVITLLIFALLGEVASILYGGRMADAIYIMLRTSLAFSVFFIVYRMVGAVADIEMMLKAATAGVLITASLMIMSSLPFTRSVANSFFAISFLEPASRSVAAAYAEYGEVGVRGRTLVGVSILGATFINIGWPLAALLWQWPGLGMLWRRLAMAACFLAPMAVLMSYSRGPILGTMLIVLATLVLGLRQVRAGIVQPVLVAACLVAAVGVGSQLFFFDRLVNRTQAMFEDPMSDERESERLFAYIEPFEHLARHPQFLISGQGVSLSRSGVVTEEAGKATHAVFAKAYYTRGMLAALLHVVVVVLAGLYAWRNLFRALSGPGRALAQAVFLSTVAILPWFAFGHAMISAPRGTMVFFFTLGLLAALSRFAVRATVSAPAPDPTYKVADVQSRHTAV
jgi:hypothetical protein